MTITPIVAPTVSAYPAVETQAAMNTALADICNKLNEAITTLNGMVNPAAVDLSGYVTTGTLDTHKASFDHTGMVAVPSGVAGKQYVIQYKDGTLAAGTATITWDTSYASGAILFAWAVNTTASPAGAVSVPTGTVTTTQATVKGTGTDTFRAFALGYV